MATPEKDQRKQEFQRWDQLCPGKGYSHSKQTRLQEEAGERDLRKALGEQSSSSRASLDDRQGASRDLRGSLCASSVIQNNQPSLLRVTLESVCEVPMWSTIKGKPKSRY